MKLWDKGKPVRIPLIEVLVIEPADLSLPSRTVPYSLTQLRDYINGGEKGLEGDVVRRIAGTLGLREDDVRDAWRDRAPKRDPHKYGGPLTRSKFAPPAVRADYWKGSWLRDGVAVQATETPARHPEYGDDPEAWWAVQDPRTQLQILRAMAAERLFKIIATMHMKCESCKGAGRLNCDPYDFTDPVRCPICRGKGTVCTILYR